METNSREVIMTIVFFVALINGAYFAMIGSDLAMKKTKSFIRKHNITGVLAKYTYTISPVVCSFLGFIVGFVWPITLTILVIRHIRANTTV